MSTMYAVYVCVQCKNACVKCPFSPEVLVTLVKYERNTFFYSSPNIGEKCFIAKNRKKVNSKNKCVFIINVEKMILLIYAQSPNKKKAQIF